MARIRDHTRRVVYNARMDRGSILAHTGLAAHATILTVVLAAAMVVLSHGLVSAGSRSATGLTAPRDLVSAYIEAVTLEDWERAESLWVPHALAMAGRLGIQYTGVAAKYDCASPVYRLRGRIRDGSVQVVLGEPERRGLFFEVSVHLVTGEGETSAPYYIVPFADDWRLATRLDALSRGWWESQTRYTVVHSRDSTLLNDYALKALDAFVDSVGRRLGVSANRMALLEEKKSDYYLGRTGDIERLTGFVTPGLTDLPSDAVISSHLPHYHELVHLLVNFALEEVGLYTLPCIQEGLAVCWGGRWGKSPAVMRQLGAFVIANELATMEDVITYQGFHGSGLPPDLAYAVSGILVQAFLETMGTDRFLLLYARCSGDDAGVQALTADSLKTAVSEVAGVSWSSVVERCGAIVWAHGSSGIDPGAPHVPGATPLPSTSDALAGTVARTDSGYTLEIIAKGAAPIGALLFGDTCHSTYQSRLFAQHLPEETYRGENLGLVFDTVEVGLYDYRTDNLLAKFAAGFSSGPGIFDPVSRRIRFTLDRSLLPDSVWQESIRLIPR